MAAGAKTGGRAKGTPNKATSERIAAIVASGETPLDYMLRILRDPTVDHDRRDRMANAAAPYVHARLQAMTNPQGDGPAEFVVRWLQSSA